MAPVGGGGWRRCHPARGEEVTAAQPLGNGYVFLITQDGVVIRPPGGGDLALKKSARWCPARPGQRVARWRHSQRHAQWREIFHGAATGGKTGWLMGALVPYDAALAPVSSICSTLWRKAGRLHRPGFGGRLAGIAQLMRGSGH